MWLDASDATTIQLRSGLYVTNWLDKSGNNRHVSQADNNKQPTNIVAGLNGKGLVAFDGTDDVVSNSTAALLRNVSGATLALVSRRTSNVAAEGAALCVGHTSNTRGQLNYGLSAGIACGGRTAVGDSPYRGAGPVAYNSSHAIQIGMLNYGGQSVNLFTNGNFAAFTNLVSAGNTPNDAGAVALGANIHGGYTCNVEIAEAIIYPSVLSLDDRQKLEGYLAWKWGLQGTLPATHPYKAAAPTYPDALASWTPKHASGLDLWLASDDLDGDGVVEGASESGLVSGDVATWADKSTFGRNATGTVRPTYTTSGLNGLAVCRFDGVVTGDVLVTTCKLPDRYSVFAVAKKAVQNPDTGSSLRPVVMTSEVGGTFGGVGAFRDVNVTTPGTTNAIDFILGSSRVTPVEYSWTNTESLVASCTYDGSTLTGWKNGNAYSSPYSAVVTNFGIVQIGGLSNSNPRRFAGDIAEAIVLGGAASASDRQKTEGYLAWKWGLQGKLPAGHPYKDAAPIVGIGSRVPQPQQMKITFGGYTNRSEVLTNFPVLVMLRPNVGGSGFGYTNFATDTGHDLRFGTDATPPTTGLNYEIESWDPNGASYVWVQVPTIPGNGSGAIWANWGNTATSNQLPCTTNGATWTNGFSSVWHFGRTNGVPDLRDWTSYRRDGTNAGTVSETGFVGNGVDFEASSSNLVDVPTGLSSTYIPATNAPITVSFWFNPESIPTNHLGARMINLHDSVGGPSTVLTIGLAFTNRVQLFIDGAQTTGGGIVNFISAPISVGQWYYASVTYRSNMCAFIVNDVTVASTNSANMNPGAAYPAKIGNVDLKITSTYYDGLIDEARISSVARSTNWIWAEYVNMASNTVFSNYGPKEPLPSPKGTLFMLR